MLRVDACGQPLAGWTLGGAGKDAGVALGRLSSGDLVVVGDTESFESALEVFVTRITSAGQVAWSAAVGGPGWDAAVEVTATSDDGVVVPSETYNFGPGAPKTHNLLVFSLDSGRRLRWEQTLGGGIDADAGFGLLRENDDGSSSSARPNPTATAVARPGAAASGTTVRGAARSGRSRRPGSAAA